MSSRHYISLMLLLPFLLISCASTTEPSLKIDGPVVPWDLEFSTNCYWPFPGKDAWNAIQINHARAKIKLTELFSDSFTGRSMDEAGWPGSPSNCSVYEPPPSWTEENYIDKDLDKIEELINQNTNMESPNQRIRFLVYSHHWLESIGFGQNDEICSGGSRAFRITRMNNAIRRVGVVFVDDLHKYACLKNRSLEWLAEELILTALHEMGHVSTHETDLIAHPNHSGDFDDCCALRSPTPDNSDCRKSPGYCDQHFRAIADKREELR
jgi:hypothetical protein